MTVDLKRPKLRTWVAKPHAFDRGAARADALIARLAVGNCSADEFPKMLLNEIRFTKLDSEVTGIVATLAERLADSLTRPRYIVATASETSQDRAHVCKNVGFLDESA